jgi:hypothetical protein
VSDGAGGGESFRRLYFRGSYQRSDISDQEERGKVISYQFSVVSKERKSPDRVGVNAGAEKKVISDQISAIGRKVASGEPDKQKRVPRLRGPTHHKMA